MKQNKCYKRRRRQAVRKRQRNWDNNRGRMKSARKGRSRGSKIKRKSVRKR
jgi:hypothetical protein